MFCLSRPDSLISKGNSSAVSSQPLKLRSLTAHTLDPNHKDSLLWMVRSNNKKNRHNLRRWLIRYLESTLGFDIWKTKQTNQQKHNSYTSLSSLLSKCIFLLWKREKTDYVTRQPTCSAFWARLNHLRHALFPLWRDSYFFIPKLKKRLFEITMEFNFLSLDHIIRIFATSWRGHCVLKLTVSLLALWSRLWWMSPFSFPFLEHGMKKQFQSEFHHIAFKFALTFSFIFHKRKCPIGTSSLWPSISFFLTNSICFSVSQESCEEKPIKKHPRLT